MTFNSLFSLYQFLRMPYGIQSANDICQQKIAQIIDGTDGAANSQDDIIICEAPNQNLKAIQ